MTSRRSFLTSLGTALLAAPLLARTTLTRKPWVETREEHLERTRVRLEAPDPSSTYSTFDWHAEPHLYASYAICRLPKGVTTAEVMAKADPTIGYPVTWTTSNRQGTFYASNSRGYEHLVVGVGYDGYTTPVHHVQSPVTY